MEKTSQQKWELMAALYQHGTNVPKLASVLQSSWTKPEIIAAMTRYARRAQKQKDESNESEQRDVPLQQWLSYIKNLHTIEDTTNKHKGRISKDALPKDYSPLLSKVMLYSACFEEHYQGNSKDDPNYSEIYRYLSQLLAGEEPTQLTPPSATKVLDMINGLKKIINHKDSYEYFRSLHSQSPLNPYLQNAAPSTPPRRNEYPGQLLESAGLSGSECPPFDEGENIPLEEDLDENDPYFELKKEKLKKRLDEFQKSVGINLLDIPGINPLKMKDNDLVKPKHPTIDHLNPAKRRKLALVTDKEVSGVSLTAERELVRLGSSGTTPINRSNIIPVARTTVIPLSKLQVPQIGANSFADSSNIHFIANKTSPSHDKV